MQDLREVMCGFRGCGRALYLCSGCDRGRRYCSDRCRDAARHDSMRRARRKYALSDRGRRKNRERQERWRERQARRVRNGSVFTGEGPCVEVVPCTGLASSEGEAGSGDGSTAGPRQEPDVPASAVDARYAFPFGARGLRPGAVTLQLSPHVQGLPSGSDRQRAQDGDIRRCDVCGCIGRVVHRSAKRGRFRWQGTTSRGS
jgi:hypothetical protein